MPSSFAASIAFVRSIVSFGPSVVSPRAHCAVTRIVSSPASFARSMRLFANAGSCCSTTSSAAPTIMNGPPAAAEGATTSAAARMSSALFTTPPKGSLDG